MEDCSPNENNVNLGDRLVSYFVNKRVLLPIKRIDETGVFASGDLTSEYCLYKEAVILKKDNKTYLVGDEVKKRS